MRKTIKEKESKRGAEKATERGAGKTKDVRRKGGKERESARAAPHNQSTHPESLALQQHNQQSHNHERAPRYNPSLGDSESRETEAARRMSITPTILTETLAAPLYGGAAPRSPLARAPASSRNTCTAPAP